VEREDVSVLPKTPEKFPEARVCAASRGFQPRNCDAPELPIDQLSCITLSSRSFEPQSSRRRPFAGAFDATALYMWRSNVLRLRKCSSAGARRHGVKPRWYSSAQSLPVSEEEFTAVLRGILPELWGVEGKAPLGMWHSART
jgi:hypothetical protein